MMDPRQLVDEELNHIKKLWLKTKECPPLAILIKDDYRAMVQLPFYNDETKDTCNMMLRHIAIDLNPDVMIIIAEAWLTQTDDPNVIPSQSPDRKEILLVQIEFQTGEQYGCIAEIIRTGKDATLSEFDVADSKNNMGRFVGMYPAKNLN